METGSKSPCRAFLKPLQEKITLRTSPADPCRIHNLQGMGSLWGCRLSRARAAWAWPRRDSGRTAVRGAETHRRRACSRARPNHAVKNPHARKSWVKRTCPRGRRCYCWCWCALGFVSVSYDAGVTSRQIPSHSILPHTPSDAQATVWCTSNTKHDMVATWSIHHESFAMCHTPCAIHHAPCAIHHTPYTIRHTPHSTPHTVHHTPYTGATPPSL